MERFGTTLERLALYFGQLGMFLGCLRRLTKSPRGSSDDNACKDGNNDANIDPNNDANSDANDNANDDADDDADVNADVVMS